MKIFAITWKSVMPFIRNDKMKELEVWNIIFRSTNSFQSEYFQDHDQV